MLAAQQQSRRLLVLGALTGRTARFACASTVDQLRRRRKPSQKARVRLPAESMRRGGRTTLRSHTHAWKLACAPLLGSDTTALASSGGPPRCVLTCSCCQEVHSRLTQSQRLRSGRPRPGRPRLARPRWGRPRWGRPRWGRAAARERRTAALSSRADNKMVANELSVVSVLQAAIQTRGPQLERYAPRRRDVLLQVAPWAPFDFLSTYFRLTFNLWAPFDFFRLTSTYFQLHFHAGWDLFELVRRYKY
jgi:hypothetical protein